MECSCQKKMYNCVYLSKWALIWIHSDSHHYPVAVVKYNKLEIGKDISKKLLSWITYGKKCIVIIVILCWYVQSVRINLCNHLKTMFNTGCGQNYHKRCVVKVPNNCSYMLLEDAHKRRSSTLQVPRSPSGGSNSSGVSSNSTNMEETPLVRLANFFTGNNN